MDIHNVNWGLIILVFLFTLRLGAAIAKHGEEETSKYHAGTSLVIYVIQIGLLYWAVRR